MRFRSILATLLLLTVTPCFAQTIRASRASSRQEPPPVPLQALANTSQPDGVIASLLAFQPAIPLGPVDVLKAYEDGKTLIAQRLADELITIAQASLANQITRDAAEYLIQDRYQVAMMQREVLSALHDSLEHDVAEAAKRAGRTNHPDAVVVVEPSSLAQARLQ